MVRPSNRSARTSCYLFLIVILANQAALAHVTLDSPLGGENLNGGFLFPIEWHPAIEHDTIDWDLWYSTTGPAGPWLEIASDLPLGDPSQNAPHSFDWYVPNSALSQAWVRVRQDNTGQDYFDVSSASFSITEALEADFTGNNIVDDEDFLVWEDGFGTSTDALFFEGDGDADGDIDGLDFLLWQREHDPGSLSFGTSPVPEPSALFLLLLGAIALSALTRRRATA